MKHKPIESSHGLICPWCKARLPLEANEANDKHAGSIYACEYCGKKYDFRVETIFRSYRQEG